MAAGMLLSYGSCVVSHRCEQEISCSCELHSSHNCEQHIGQGCEQYVNYNCKQHVAITESFFPISPGLTCNLFVFEKWLTVDVSFNQVDRETTKRIESKNVINEETGTENESRDDAEDSKDVPQSEDRGKRRSGRMLRKQTVEPSKSLDNWVHKGNTKTKANRTVSTVTAVDLNESDSQFMVYAAMVHHAEDSFVKQDASDKPPNLEAEGKEDSPPELQIESTAIESPKDRLPALDAEASVGPSVKDNPPKLESEISASSDIKNKGNASNRPVKKARRYNPAACDSRELDMLTSLDLSPIKVASNNADQSDDVNDTNEGKDVNKGKQNKKRKISQVDSGSAILQWIEASNVSKPAKRAKKDGSDKDSFNGCNSLQNNSLQGKDWKSNDDGTFSYKNKTYEQPLLLLSRVKISMMDNVSPAKAREPFTMHTSTPKTTQLANKLKFSSGDNDGKENTSNVSDSRAPNSVLKAEENRAETPLSDKSSTSSSSEKQTDTPRKRVEKQTRASPSPNNETTKSESLEKRDTLSKSISPVNKPAKQNRVPEKHMSPVVVLKPSDIVSTGGMKSANITREKARGGARRTIDLHSDGNESDEDSRGNRDKDSEFLVESSSPIRRMGSDIIETFSIDSDSEDESFAPMQAAVDDLLTDLPVEETQSPYSSPLAKKTSPKKGTSKRSKKKSTSDDRKHDDANDDDTDGRVGDSNSIYNKRKTAEEKFDELLGFSNGM